MPASVPDSIESPQRRVRRAPALRLGDRVAVLSPAGPVRDAEGLRRGLARLKSWRLEPVLMPHARDQRDYLGGTDEARAADLQAAIDDPEIRGIFATRGGYGCMRILERLEFEGLARDPKPIVGFSDLTALLAAVWREVGLVGLHGPMVAHGEELAPSGAFETLQRTLLGRAAPVPLPADGEHVPHAITPGTAEGRLVGGNLTLVTALLGSRWQIETRGALLFLEDVDEAPYRVDRMLTQLRLGGFLQRAAGVIFGDFHTEGRPLASEDPAITAVLHERTADLGIPVAYGFPFGHRPRSWTLPFGAGARLDCRDAGGPAQLRLREAAVR